MLSQPIRAAWIEIPSRLNLGIKNTTSQPIRAAWIEIRNQQVPYDGLTVAALLGCVDLNIV